MVWFVSMHSMIGLPWPTFYDMYRYVLWPNLYQCIICINALYARSSAICILWHVLLSFMIWSVSMHYMPGLPRPAFYDMYHCLLWPDLYGCILWPAFHNLHSMTCIATFYDLIFDVWVKKSWKNKIECSIKKEKQNRNVTLASHFSMPI